LLTLRALVAALGERTTPPWWRTQFLTEAGMRAVGRIFPRTAVSAAVKSACIAARSEHDRLIGVGKRYHLFRLPTRLEHAIATSLADSALQSALADILREGTDRLLGELKSLSGERTVMRVEGPVSIGDVNRLDNGRGIAEFAAHYYAAFAQTARCYPYFEEREGRK